MNPEQNFFSKRPAFPDCIAETYKKLTIDIEETQQSEEYWRKNLAEKVVQDLKEQKHNFILFQSALDLAKKFDAMNYKAEYLTCQLQEIQNTQ